MVRKMEMKDVREVHKLELECFSKPWSEASLENEVKKESSLFMVYETEGKVVAYAGMYLVIDEGDITNVAVTKEYRNKGIANTLLKEMFKQAKEKEIKAFTLEVRKSNLAAIKLYEKLGFENEGIRKNFYDDPKEDGIIMWLR